MLQQRKSIRLTGYDYSSEGAYFITVCTIDRTHLLGHVVGADDSVRPIMKISEMGQIIFDCWSRISDIHKGIVTDAFCIMPNHVHGIIIVSEGGGQGRPPLQKVMQGFKSVTTRLCFEMGYRTIWQRSYHDHIIRNEAEYREIRQYIDDNPAKWMEDIYFSEKH